MLRFLAYLESKSVVHVWSVPLAYFRRSYIVYRSRDMKIR
ncbi:respiratory nitrate reductase subunit gamma [Effusibacillus pohliae]|nr:respiratory nitrate reductase subunit gamma [Effusibacillus pohliae]